MNRFANQFEWFVQFPAARAESSEAVHSDNIKSNEDVALDLQSIESKSAKACLLELYEYLLLDEHHVCCLLFHRYRPRYHYDITPETVLQEDSPSFQRQQRHSEPVAGDSDHYGLQAPTTDLWQHHPPAERAECLLCSLWGTKRHHCTEDSTSSRRPGDVAVPRQREEIPQQDQCTQSSGSWQHSWAVELTDVFTDIFNISLSQAVVPTCFKATTIIPVPKTSSTSCFNDYRPVALTPILMKCFERLVMQHIKSVLPPSLDPFQFAYRSNRSTDDAIATALHPALTHLDKTDTYVRLLFIDFSSAFNTIIPQQLIHKLVQLGLNTSLCNWLLDFLTGRPQAVRVGSNTSSTITLNTGAPQGCVLSPLLFTLLTHDCTPSHNSNLFIKFADDTTVVGLISNRDETNYRSEVSRLARWCSDNNLSLNVEKTKEIVVDFRRVHSLHAPLTINGATVERVSSTKFLGVHITEDLSWTNNTAALAKKAQQRLYFLRKLRRARAPAPIMCIFYRGTIESILTSCITVWYGACNASCRKSLQRIVRAAEKIVGVSLRSLQDIYSTRLTHKALYIAGDTTHPTHSFFSLLPSGRRLRSLQARTNRLKDSFIHQAVRKLNSLPSLPPPPLSYTTHHWTLTHWTRSWTTELEVNGPPPPPTHPPHPPHTTHTNTHTVTSTSHFVHHWTDLIQLPLLTVWIKTALFLSL